MRPLGVLEDGAGVDFPSLRAARLGKVDEAMAAADVDVLLLGRQGNCRYVVGHRPIWRAVVTAWGPFVAVVRDPDGEVAVHLMHTTWDDGVPPEVPRSRITGLTWHPRNVVATIAGLPGLAAARRIGVDGMSPGMAKLLAHVAPSAALVDGEALLRSCRAVKLPAEVECLRTAVAVTEGALAAVVASDLAPGVRESTLRGRFCEELGRYGVNHPAMEPVVAATSPSAPGPRFLPAPDEDRVVADGDLVALQVAAPWAGYEGSVGRTWPVPGSSGSGSAAQRAVWERWRAAAAAVVAACRPGATASDLRAAWRATGEELPPVPVAHGVGIGVEQPVVGRSAVETGSVLESGMVLAVQGTVTAVGAGTVLAQELVLVGDDGPEVLTRLSHGPLAGDT